MKYSIQETLNHLAVDLRKLRQEHGWELEDVQQKTGISVALLKKMESGEDFDVNLLFLLCNLYEIKPKNLFLWELEEHKEMSVK